MSEQQRAVIYNRVSKDKRDGRSVAQQERDSRAVCEREGWRVAAVRTDNDVSASRFTTRQRVEWQRLVDELDAEQYDVLVLWEPSRGSRDLTAWAVLLDACRRHGVLVHVVSHAHTYDLSKPRDWRTLAEDGVDSAYESEKTSQRIRRDMRASAEAGRPHGRIPYGYRRRYDPTTKALVAQEADPDTAPIVRRVVEELARGVPVSAITDRLNSEGIPAARGGRWTRQVVRKMGLNRAYAGEREHKGQVHRGEWPELVDPALHATARRLLSDPARKTTRPGAVKHLCSYVVTCGVCGQGLQAAPRGRPAQPTYFCPAFHVSAKEAWLDEVVTELVLVRIDVPEVRARLEETDDAETVAARAEATALRDRLAGFEEAAMRGEISPESFGRIEAGLRAEIADADRRGRARAQSSAVAELLSSGDVRARWETLPLPARREVVRLLVDVQLNRATVHGRTNVLDPERLSIVWR